MIKTISPIFFAKTRSFWLAIFPGILTIIDVMFQSIGTGTGSEPIADAIALLLNAGGIDWTGAQIASYMQKLSPLYILIFAQQRGTFSGAIPRPYTIDLTKENAVTQAIEDGKSAFEAGKALGRSLLKK